jgi:hypothetical protein
MALETVTDIDDLVITNPTSSDPKSQGDDHLRNLKIALKNAFPGFTSSVVVVGTTGGSANTYTMTPSTALPAYAVGTLICAKITDANTGASTMNISGLGAGAIQTIDGAALILGDLQAGRYAWMVVTAATPVYQLLAVTKNYVDQQAFAAALPSQTGNDGKLITTDGSAASWSELLKTGTIRFADSTDTTKRLAFDVSGVSTGTTRTVTIPNSSITMVGTDSTQTLTNKSLQDSTTFLIDNADATKKAQFQLSGISTGTTRTLTIADADFTLEASGLKPLSTVTASGSGTIDVETTFDGTSDAYLLVVSGIKTSADGAVMQAYMKIGGAYDTGNNYKYHCATLKSDASTYAADASNASGVFNIMNSGIGNAANEGASFSMMIFNPSSTALSKHVTWHGSGITAAGLEVCYVGAAHNTGTAALTGIRISPSSGTVTAVARLYAIKNS